MSRLELFLKNLSNSELAIFIRYRYREFLPKSKEIINAEVSSRKLNYTKILKLFNEGLQTSEKESEIRCQRCNSNRIIIEKEKKLRGGNYATYEVTIEYNRCLLCGYKQKNNFSKFFNTFIKKNFHKYLLRIFKNGKTLFKEFYYFD